MTGSLTNLRHGPSRRRRDIQGLRGVAVVLVVLYHSGLPVPGGFIGVDVFFVVSGFVITLMLRREFETTGTISLRRFYNRRARRLLPALGLMLTVVAILSIAILGPLGQQELAVKTGISAALFVANFQLIAAPGDYFAGGLEGNPFLHTWSLSVEEQFYLFLPITLSLLWLLARKLRHQHPREALVAGAVFAIVVASFALSYTMSTAVGTGPPPAQAQAFFSSLTRVWEFGAGVLLALASRRLAGLPLVAARGLGILGLALLSVGAFTISEVTPFPSTAAVIPVLGTAMLIAAGTSAPQIWTSRALSAKPAVWLGDISYSWYLWHWPLIVFAQTLWPTSPTAASLAAAVALGPALVAYHHVEQPIRLGERFPNANGLRTTAGVITASMIALTVLSLSGQAVRDLPEVSELANSTRNHLDAALGCDAVGADIASDCTWPADDARGSVYLVGDSNAGQFTEALALAATEAHFDLTLAIRAGCPPIDVSSLFRGYPKSHCLDFPQSAAEAVLRDRPDIVILAAASDIYIEEDRWQLVDPATGEVVGDPDGKALLWQQGLENFVRELVDAGVEVYVVNPIPHFFGAYDRVRVEDCPMIRLITDTTRCGIEAPRDTLNDLRRRAMEAELGAVTNLPTVSAVDFFDMLCPGAACSMYADGRWLYSDGTHLSVDASLELTDTFYALIAGATAP